MSQTRQTHYTQPVWFPQASQLALLTNVTGSLNQLALYDVPSHQLRVVTHGEEQISGIHPSPSGDSMVYIASHNGHEKLQMYLYTISTKEHRALTNNPLAMHRGASWSPDGRYIVYSANSTHENEFHIFELDTLTHNIIPVIVEDGCWDSLGYSPSGRYIVVRKRKGFHNHDMYIWDRFSRILHPILVEETVHFECKMAYWSPDESVIYAISNWNVDLMRVIAVHLSSGYVHTVYEASHDVDQWAMTKDCTRALVCENINGAHTVHVLERQESGYMVTASKEMGGYVRSLSWSSDDQHVALSYDSPQYFTHIRIFDAQLNTIARIPQQEDKVFAPTAPQPQPFSFESFDGMTINGLSYTPQGSGPFPVIVHLHGGPEDQHRYQYSAWIHRLIEEGYAVVAPNIRGSIGFGKKFMASDDREKRFDAIADLNSLHAWIVKQTEYDEHRCVLSGGSYGAFLTLAGLVWQPALWQAGICRVGMYDLNHFFAHTAPWRKELRAVEYGHPDTDTELLRVL
ncbi:MAG: prolyl oligopeptidase family serine peptidase, partial [Candidatus Kerfeldbacteria bacterium]|nr:prolyl oligopeptidase family serine peptidase [Candidatus Kerfeldbacteria bacterium]